MRNIRLVFALLMTGLGASPAFACGGPFWATPPEERGPEESVIEIQYLGVWKEPTYPDGDRLPTGCSGGVGVFRYRITRVLDGEFNEAEIYLQFEDRGLGHGEQRYIVVGRLAEGSDALPRYFLARSPPLDQRLLDPREIPNVSHQLHFLRKAEELL